MAQRVWKLEETPNLFPEISNRIIESAISGPPTYQGHGCEINSIIFNQVGSETSKPAREYSIPNLRIIPIITEIRVELPVKAQFSRRRNGRILFCKGNRGAEMVSNLCHRTGLFPDPAFDEFMNF